MPGGSRISRGSVQGYLTQGGDASTMVVLDEGEGECNVVYVYSYQKAYRAPFGNIFGIVYKKKKNK